MASQSASRSKKNEPVADSWEDEIDDAEENVAHDQNLKPSSSSKPDAQDRQTNRSEALGEAETAEWNPYEQSTRSDPGDSQAPSRDIPERRPEKSTAVISRMLAGSLGVRVQRTKEQKDFDRAQIENEKKKRDLERARKEDEERQKRSIWED